MSPLRIGFGVVVWAALLAAAVWSLAGRGERSPVSPRVTDQLRQYAAGRRHTVQLLFDFGAPVRPGDPIFVVQHDRVWQVGELAAVAQDGERTMAEALFYASAPAIGSGASMHFHETPDSIAWVLQTMFPEATRQEMATELRDAFAAHQQEIRDALRPVMAQTLREVYRVVEQDLPAAIQRRRERLGEFGDRYQEEIVQQELAPLVRAEIWPIVQHHAEPVLVEVGQEIWQRASLWRFGWRFAYDRSPLPERNLTSEEWQRFLQQEAIPVVEDHLDEIMSSLQNILADVGRSAAVRDTLRSSLTRVLDDPQMQQIAWEIAREVTLENPRMRAVIEQQWQSERARAAMEITAARLEPTAARIGALLLGTPEEGITPEFARVLRSQVLGKDRRWLTLELTGSDTGRGELPARLVVRRGAADALHPFVREPILPRVP